jgi:hypothetical protein
VPGGRGDVSVTWERLKSESDVRPAATSTLRLTSDEGVSESGPRVRNAHCGAGRRGRRAGRASLRVHLSAPSLRHRARRTGRRRTGRRRTGRRRIPGRAVTRRGAVNPTESYLDLNDGEVRMSESCETRAPGSPGRGRRTRRAAGREGPGIECVEYTISPYGTCLVIGIQQAGGRPAACVRRRADGYGLGTRTHGPDRR